MLELLFQIIIASLASFGLVLLSSELVFKLSDFWGWLDSWTEIDFNKISFIIKIKFLEIETCFVIVILVMDETSVVLIKSSYSCSFINTGGDVVPVVRNSLFEWM